MYDRPNGSPFTVTNPQENKDLIDMINKNDRIADFAVCVGLESEQFTGRINFVLLKMGNKYMRYRVTGTFPTMRLDNRESNNVLDIVFPTSSQKEFLVSKPVTTYVKKEGSIRPVIKEEPKKEETSITIEDKMEIVDNIPEEKEEVIPEPAAELEKSQPQVQNKPRGRKKKKLTV